MRWVTRNPRCSVPIGLALTGGLAWIVFGFFGFHLLFIDDEVSEAPPVFAAAPTTTSTIVPATAEAASVTPATTAVEQSSVPIAPPTTARPATAPPTTQPPTTAPPATTAPPVVTQPKIVTEYAGSFVSRNHPTSGSALVLGDGSGQRFLRFEQFETDNGPDLNVYLVNSSAGGISDFVDLGDLKGNIGDQNYEIPRDTDLNTYDTVLIWCVRFDSAFGEATLVIA